MSSRVRTEARLRERSSSSRGVSSRTMATGLSGTMSIVSTARFSASRRALYQREPSLSIPVRPVTHHSSPQLTTAHQ
ncbi:hypothetical protein DDJ31_31785 [Streptomyces griseoviridis]|uniref:Uncharacterized protein n=1 Tax=Streptomyces griseoviridis TaxID=45398 RepID=A0ABX5U550_STRGD|nr:hypothetical protein DDJ31_31785 [Streptomyces griseoviridis]